MLEKRLVLTVCLLGSSAPLADKAFASLALSGILDYFEASRTNVLGLQSLGDGPRRLQFCIAVVPGVGKQDGRELKYCIVRAELEFVSSF